MLRLKGILTIAVMISFIGIGAQGVDLPPSHPIQTRADIITIDTLRAFGDLERPPVVFLHDKHSDAMQKQQKDCQTCHLSQKDQLSPKFKRFKDTKRQTVMDVYHTNCIACHKETKAAAGNSGPVECGGCHRAKADVISLRLPMELDKSLHFRHAKANANKCELCHHEYDTKTKKLFYAKDMESTCRYCHLQKTEENRISMRLASHSSCIGCHSQRLVQNKDAGPLKCSGCHDPMERKLIEKTPDVPRMERKQPDIVFVKKDSNTKPVPADMRMNPVPFNHKKHEGYNDTCRVCHHADLNPCSKCHTLSRSKDGKFLNLADSMHQLQSRQSCLGCHASNQQDKNCAGCHATMPATRKLSSESCRTCHISPLPKGAASDDNKLAVKFLDARLRVTSTFSDKDIPEKVMIKGLSKKYEPVEFPHRKIVATLMANIKDNKLTQFFHTQEGTLCQGCHHNSPASKKPPGCGSCHGEPFSKENLFKPGLMAAYHRQCIECHAVMGIEKPAGNDCIACHIEKKNW